MEWSYLNIQSEYDNAFNLLWIKMQFGMHLDRSMGLSIFEN
jgi:hypothetical protein